MPYREPDQPHERPPRGPEIDPARTSAVAAGMGAMWTLYMADHGQGLLDAALQGLTVHLLVCLVVCAINEAD